MEARIKDASLAYKRRISMMEHQIKLFRETLRSRVAEYEDNLIKHENTLDALRQRLYVMNDMPFSLELDLKKKKLQDSIDNLKFEFMMFSEEYHAKKYKL